MPSALKAKAIAAVVAGMKVCSIDGCGRPRTGASRYCGTHVSRLRRHGDANANFRRVKGKCSIDGCVSPHHSNGLCKKHDTRAQRHGDPLVKLNRKGDGRQCCVVGGCVSPVKAFGLCVTHNARQKRWGNTDGRSVECRYCQRAFITQTRQKLCSQACYRASRRTPEIRLIKRAYYHKYNARKRGLGAEVVCYASVLERDGWICQICKHPIDRALSHPHRMSASIDHVIPLSRGGVHTYSNVQAAHYSCNSRKNATMPTDQRVVALAAIGAGRHLLAEIRVIPPDRMVRT